MSSLQRVIKIFSADVMLVYAAALSYQLFFSLFPFVIFLLPQGYPRSAFFHLLNLPIHRST